MCKYCEDYFIISEKDVDVYVRGDRLVVDTYSENSTYNVSVADINYCPMCGEPLR